MFFEWLEPYIGGQHRTYIKYFCGERTLIYPICNKYQCAQEFSTILIEQSDDNRQISINNKLQIYHVDVHGRLNGQTENVDRKFARTRLSSKSNFNGLETLDVSKQHAIWYKLTQYLLEATVKRNF